MYATIQDMRDRGVAEDAADDAKVQSALERACVAIDSYCGRNFKDRQETYHLDGTGRRLLFLDDRPVITIESIKVDDLELMPEDYRVYRDEGYIKLVGYTLDLFTRLAGVFPLGEQNVEVKGKFGFQAVPPEVKEACILIALDILKNRASEADVSKSSSSSTENAVGIKSVKVGDIAVQFEYPSVVTKSSAFTRTTGVYEADRLLLKYRKDLEAVVI